MFFDNCKTLEELKSLYKKMALKWHPDRAGGDLETMKKVNAEYDYFFNILKNVHRKKDGTTWTATGTSATTEAPDYFKDLVGWLIHLQNITIEIIGAFVWISGDTRPYKTELSKRGFKWSANKKSWYLAPKWYKKTNNKQYSMAEIKSMYGVRYSTQSSGVDEIE